MSRVTSDRVSVTCMRYANKKRLLARSIFQFHTGSGVSPGLVPTSLCSHKMFALLFVVVFSAFSLSSADFVIQNTTVGGLLSAKVIKNTVTGKEKT